jgi:hypothetical protein
MPHEPHDDVEATRRLSLDVPRWSVKAMLLDRSMVVVVIV